MTNPATPNGPRLIARSKGPSATISLDDLGPPGSHSYISIVPQFSDHEAQSRDALADTNLRRFIVSCCLSKDPWAIGRDQTIKGDFGDEDGDSYLIGPPGVAKIKYEIQSETFFIHKNKNGELSSIYFECSATNHQEARNLFINAVFPALDHLSYTYGIPVFIRMVRVFDSTHQATHLMVVSPNRHQTVADSSNELFIEMRPIYAMYREAKNSPSDFYKFLCFYKIMEGLLNGMRADAFARARARGIALETRPPVVPTASFVPSDLQEYLGKPIKVLFDRVLTVRFRNAVAHLRTVGGLLDVSSPAELERFAGLALVADLCTRELMWSHERLLAQLKM